MSGGLAAIGEGEDPTRLQADANYRPSAITRGYRMSGGLAAIGHGEDHFLGTQALGQRKRSNRVRKVAA
jgi:hypothetical protein